MSEKFEVIPPGGAEAPPAADPKAQRQAAPKKNSAVKETAGSEALAKALAEVEELKAKLAASQQATIDSLTKRIEELEAGKKTGKAATPKAELKNALAVEDADDLIPVDVDLAPNSRFLLIDGTAYQHGLTYYVTPIRAQTINEMCSRTWAHEQEVGLTRRGPSNNFQNRPVTRDYDTKTHGHLVKNQTPVASLEGVSL